MGLRSRKSSRNLIGAHNLRSLVTRIIMIRLNNDRWYSQMGWGD